MSVGKAIRAASYLLLFLTVWFLWPRELDGFVLGRDGRLAVPDYSMKNARYVSVQHGKVEMESVSEEAAYDLMTRTMTAKNVVAHFYNEQQQKTEVKADTAIFHSESGKVFLKDNVVSRSPDGFTMRGSEAEYRSHERILLADQPVEGELDDRSLKIWGDKAHSVLDERVVDLIGNARTHFVDKKRGLTKVRGERARMDREKQEVIFRNQVRMDQDKIVATSNVAHLFYSAKEKNVRYLSMLEDVKIQEEGGRYTRSQVAEFFAPTDTIVLSSFPAVYRGDDVVTGDRITLYRTTGVVEVMATNAAGSGTAPVAPSRPHVLTPEDEELIP